MMPIALTMNALSFPDFAVLGFELDEVSHRLSIEVEGAWLELDGGRALGRGPAAPGMARAQRCEV